MPVRQIAPVVLVQRLQTRQPSPEMSSPLIREAQTDLAPFPAPVLEAARSQWVLVLSNRMHTLDQALHHVPNDMEYGGAAAHSLDIEPLEAAVDEARRMVCALSGEMRRRSEGELPVWGKNAVAPNTARGLSAGV